jgi:hypothetical protein
MRDVCVRVRVHVRLGRMSFSAACGRSHRPICRSFLLGSVRCSSSARTFNPESATPLNRGGVSARRRAMLASLLVADQEAIPESAQPVRTRQRESHDVTREAEARRLEASLRDPTDA